MGYSMNWKKGLLLSTGLLIALPLWPAPLTITMEGINTDLQQHVLSHLTLAAEQGRDEVLPSRLQRLHSQALQEIKTALQVFGFYKAVVSGELNQTVEGWAAHYRIEPGSAIPIGTLDVQIQGEGQSDTALQNLLGNFALQQGQPLEHPRYDLARDGLLRLAVERGYLDAALRKHEVRVDLRAYTASVELQLDTGKRYHFGAVQFSENNMKQTLLNRYVKFKQGDPYNPLELLKLQTALSNSGYFQRVEVRPRQEKTAEDVVPIEVDLESRLPRQWRFGLGYASDTGPRGTLSHQRLMGNEGDKFQSDLLLSEKLRRIIAAYTIPLQDPITEQLALALRFSNEITDSRDSYITGVSLSYTSLWDDWRRTLSLNRDREVYVVADQPEDTKQIFYPILSLDRISADDRIRPRHGSRIHVEVRGADETVLSDVSFLQLRSGLKWVGSMGSDGRVLLRADLGTTEVSDVNKLPASQRFFAGGDNSVRGYAYEELGPKNALGVVVGGKHLIVGGIELEQNLTKNWSSAVFYDVGNAINSTTESLLRGAGVGLRWKSPIGPVRMDFAWALDKPQDRFRLHIVIGPDL